MYVQTALIQFFINILVHICKANERETSRLLSGKSDLVQFTFQRRETRAEVDSGDKAKQFVKCMTMTSTQAAVNNIKVEPTKRQC